MLKAVEDSRVRHWGRGGKESVLSTRPSYLTKRNPLSLQLTASITPQTPTAMDERGLTFDRDSRGCRELKGRRRIVRPETPKRLCDYSYRIIPEIIEDEDRRKEGGRWLVSTFQMPPSKLGLPGFRSFSSTNTIHDLSRKYPFPLSVNPLPHEIFHLPAGADQAAIKRRCEWLIYFLFIFRPQQKPTISPRFRTR